MGVGCAFVGVGVHTATYALVHFKNSITTSVMYTGQWATAFLYYFSISIGCTILAYACVFYEVSAAGSGLPEVKRYFYFT